MPAPIDVTPDDPQFWSGFYATAIIGASPMELPIEMWSVAPTAEMVTFKNSLSGPVVRRESTFTDVRVTLSIDYDFNPLGGIYQQLTAGATASTIKLFLHTSARAVPDGETVHVLDGPFWAFASLKVEGMPQSVTVAGKITTQITLLGNGTITYPAAS